MWYARTWDDTHVLPLLLHSPPEATDRPHTASVTTWGGNVGEENARWLASECRTARLASEYRPRDRGAGYVEVSALALGALRELGEEEDGYITDDGDGLRIWIGDDAFELEPADPGARR